MTDFAPLSILEEIDNANDTNTYAVIPVENSIEGVVRETLDNLTRLDNKEIKIIAGISEIISAIKATLVVSLIIFISFIVN